MKEGAIAEDDTTMRTYVNYDPIQVIILIFMALAGSFYSDRGATTKYDRQREQRGFRGGGGVERLDWQLMRDNAASHTMVLAL